VCVVWCVVAERRTDTRESEVAHSLFLGCKTLIIFINSIHIFTVTARYSLESSILLFYSDLLQLQLQQLLLLTLLLLLQPPSLAVNAMTTGLE
jgi:hypothetical protein